MPDLENDPRLDPRVKWALRNVPVTNLTDVDSRETLSPAALAGPRR